MDNHPVVLVVVAGGPGRRLGADLPKALVRVDNRPLLDLTLTALAHIDSAISRTVVVAPSSHMGEVEQIAGAKWPWPVAVVPGGSERQDSVRIGLDACPQADTVVIHDAARPFVTAAALERVIAAAIEHGAAITALAAVDTVKLVDDAGNVRSTPPRHEVRQAQTPQAFRRDILVAAHAAAATNLATDDAALVEATGHPVRVVAGDPATRKITTAEDLRWAEWMLHSGQWPR